MLRNLMLFLVPFVALTAAPASAQSGERGSCDVAVWTAAWYDADRMGLITGGLIDEMLKKSEIPSVNSTAAIKDMLPASRLFKLISDSKLAEILGRNVNYVHVEKSEDDAKVDRKSKMRSAASANPCYIEIYVTGIYYQSAPFHGERIFSSYHFKDFRGPKLVKGGGYDNGQMRKFSAQTVEVATEMAGGAVSEVFNKIARKRFGTEAALGKTAS